MMTSFACGVEVETRNDERVQKATFLKLLLQQTYRSTLCAASEADAVTKFSSISTQPLAL